MTANPLLADDNNGWVGQHPTMTLEDKFAWCAKRNKWAQGLGLEWWYFVGKRTEGLLEFNEIQKVEGIKAVEMRDHAAGRRFERFNPTEEEVADIHSEVAECIRRGMSQAEFRQHLARKKLKF